MSDGYFTQQVFAEVLGRRKMLKYYLKALSILTKLDFGLTIYKAIPLQMHKHGVEISWALAVTCAYKDTFLQLGLAA
jgi:hypothetical protein